jgi:hypothetical protein
MAKLSKIIDVHSHLVLSFGEKGAGRGRGINSLIGLLKVRSRIWRSTASLHACFPPYRRQRCDWTGRTRHRQAHQRGTC